jgi:hypothetical protein
VHVYLVRHAIADRQLAPLFQAERLVERDRTLGFGDPVAGVDQLHGAEATCWFGVRDNEQAGPPS